MDFVIPNIGMTDRQTSVVPLDKFTVLCYNSCSKIDKGVLQYGSW